MENYKELLMKDLCTRLHNGVVVNAQYKDREGWKSEDRKLLGIYADGQVYVDAVYTDIEKIKPYLRPMSSMTEEEKDYIKYRWCYDDWTDIHDFLNNYKIDAVDAHYFTDWLNSHHFDYRVLIEKGLALEAPEDMYN